MRRRRHLVIFAKLPRLGQVKRRLAAGIGVLAALRFYRTTAERVIHRLGCDRRWSCYVAVTPDRGATGRPGWRIAARRIAQGEGNLGRRMARPFRTLPPGPVVIVGTDIPAIAAADIAAAFALLGSNDFVLGPASDGGYWLFGSRRRPLPPGVFAGVRWSTEHALADTLTTLPRRHSVALAAMLADVDDVAGYRRWRVASSGRA